MNDTTHVITISSEQMQSLAEAIAKLPQPDMIEVGGFVFRLVSSGAFGPDHAALITRGDAVVFRVK